MDCGPNSGDNGSVRDDTEATKMGRARRQKEDAQDIKQPLIWLHVHGQDKTRKQRTPTATRLVTCSNNIQSPYTRCPYNKYSKL